MRRLYKHAGSGPERFGGQMLPEYLKDWNWACEGVSHLSQGVCAWYLGYFCYRTEVVGPGTSY